jgi:2-polyprenyl-3-methyl-5-hydroxy-6-metoxy-1,4-benzoquinol methylase
LYQQGDNWQYEPVDRTDWQIAAAWLKAHLSRASVLDIGCYDGGILSFLGDGFQGYGVEIHELAARRAEQKGIHILGSDFAEIEDFSIKFDAVVAMDFVEHVDDPFRFINLMRLVTRQGGFIIVSTGNTDAPSWRFMGSRY